MRRNAAGCPAAVAAAPPAAGRADCSAIAGRAGCLRVRAAASGRRPGTAACPACSAHGQADEAGRADAADAKVRVYELAKEFEVESRVVMATMMEMGEFVRSAASTVEPAVVRKLRERFAASGRSQERS